MVSNTISKYKTLIQINDPRIVIALQMHGVRPVSAHQTPPNFYKIFLYDNDPQVRRLVKEYQRGALWVEARSFAEELIEIGYNEDDGVDRIRHYAKKYKARSDLERYEIG